MDGLDKRGEVICNGTHINDSAGVSVVGSAIGGGCFDVKELVLADEGMWSMVMVFG